MLETLSYQSILQRGYSVIRNDSGAPITAAAQLSPNQNITIQLHDDTCDAIISGSENAPKKQNKVRTKKSKNENANQERSIKKVEGEDELGSDGSKPQGSLF
jgi:hypothetical protein